MKATTQLILFSTIVVVASGLSLNLNEGVTKVGNTVGGVVNKVEDLGKVVINKLGGLLKIAQDLEIGDKKNKTIGVIKNMRPCGGQSKAVEWRYESCLEKDSVCVVPGDGVVRTYELDIVPSENIERPLGVRWNMRSSDGKINKLIEYGVLTPKIMKKGNVYTLHGNGAASEELKGKDLVFQFIVYDAKDEKNVIVCTETDFKCV